MVVSIWWVVLAFLAGTGAGAILVSLMSINPPTPEDGLEHPLEALDDRPLRLLT
jgi:hypothetical protein